MDKRRGLPAGASLSFPGMECEIVAEIGRGSNAIVYLGRYADALNAGQWHNVLIKELFPYHEGGAIYRAEASAAVCCTDDGRELLKLHRRSFVWGNEAHLRLRDAHPAEVSGNINTFPCNDTYYTILDFTGGRTLAAELSRADAQLTLRRIVQRIIGLLDSLSIFHSMGFVHLDISPDNILLTGRGTRERVELIDYNSIVPIAELNSSAELRLSVKPGYASPEARAHEARMMGTWTDLYSVAAVLFNCLAGRPLSSMEASGVSKPDVSGSRYLADAPETVRSLVRQILARGLAPMRRRYRTTDELRTDLCELLDRIDGVGVTHWALWEAARQGVRREIKLNPAAEYLTDEARLYPVELDAPAGSGIEALLQGSCNAVLTGSGGAGKTTLLMRTAWLESQRYRRDRPVVAYLSLYGYQPGDASFICDSLLRRMKYKPDTSSYADARHALELLLQKPLRTRTGEVPTLCLLLDGYNEIGGDTAALKSEILRLAQLDGVSLLIASRTELPEYGFERWQLRPLSEATVRAALGGAGLLMPEQPQLVQLLTNAMMLRLYIRACIDSHEQVAISSRDELIRAYLNALLSKELDALPESAPQRWQLEAALKCVYPMIADMETQYGRSASSAELAQRLERLYRCLDRRALLKRYPQWIGHVADIRGAARDADEWYGVIVHDLLWRRTGLLYKDAYGEYRVAHQEFRDVLSETGRALRPVLARPGRTRACVAFGLCAIMICACALMLCRAKPYDVDDALDALSYVQAAYMGMNGQYTAMLSLLGNARPDVSGYDSATGAPAYSFGDARRALEANTAILTLDLNADGQIASECIEAVSDRLSTGVHFPWNDMAFDSERFADMAEYFDERSERYAGYIDALEAIYAQPDDYARCIQLVRAVLNADARAAAAYDQLLLVMPLDGLAEWETTPAGSAAQGAYQRLDDGRKYCAETEAFAQADWRDLNAEQMASALTDALNAGYDARAALSKDPAYAAQLAAALSA